MYHDFLGREIEDAEMDGMHEDAREAANDSVKEAIRILRRGMALPADLRWQLSDEQWSEVQHAIKLCPFCAFFEQDARPVCTGKVVTIAACDVCSAGPDISEMLLDWYEEYVA